ncbi:MAG: ubiquinone biosynthesis regulatory protein kinase UbiB [Luminiphilus sp.]
MIRRVTAVIRTARRYRLDLLLPESRRAPLIRLLAFAGPRATVALDVPRGQRLREALESLGPVFIKFGQLLSTRRDLLPDDIADELAKLQDQVPAFPPEAAVATIERELGSSVDTLFASFDSAPLAAASVAQVHGASLHSGESVVVKILRPDIEAVVREDTKLIKFLAKWVGRLFRDGKRLRPQEVAADYERTILGELDLRREAANASQLRRNFYGSELVYVPQVIWSHTSREVMVSERIHGIPVSDIAALNERGVDLKLLAERGVETFFTQVFRDSFFHADMHPGNIFVDATDPKDPRYIAVDCAIVGQLDESDLYYLARNLLAIFQQDYRLVAKLHVECGWVPVDTPIGEFETAMRTLCEPIFERPLSEISFGHMLVSLFRTAGSFNMEVQPQLVLLQKTLLNIEGLGRQLYPTLNLWDTAKPFLERWLAERYSPQNILKKLQREMPYWLEMLPKLPELLIKTLERQPVPEPPGRASNTGILIAAGAGICAILVDQLGFQAVWPTLIGVTVLAVSVTLSLTR